MRLRDVNKLKVGDYIELKHNLGKGDITEILFHRDPDRPHIEGTFPMVYFRDIVNDVGRWATYLHIEVHNNTVRSVST